MISVETPLFISLFDIQKEVIIMMPVSLSASIALSASILLSEMIKIPQLT